MVVMGVGFLELVGTSCLEPESEGVTQSSSHIQSAVETVTSANPSYSLTV